MKSNRSDTFSSTESTKTHWSSGRSCWVDRSGEYISHPDYDEPHSEFCYSGHGL